MNKKLPKLYGKLCADAAMILLFIAALAFRITGREMHEWSGLALFLLVFLHIVAGWGWFVRTFKENHSLLRAFEGLAIFSLAIGMAIICITGVLHSRHIFSFSIYFDGENIRKIHCIAAYWCLVLAGVHTGLHWHIPVAILQKVSGAKKSNFFRIALRILSVILACYGAWASFDRNMGSKLFIGFSFDFWNQNRLPIMFFINNMAIMGMYIFAAYYIKKTLSAVIVKRRNSGLRVSKNRTCPNI